MSVDPSPPSDADANRERVIRGLAFTLPAALLAVAAVVRLDAWLDLPGWGRGVLAVGWVAAVGLAGWAWTAVPTRSAGFRFVPAVAGLLALCSLALVPAAGERVRRLFLPFYTPTPEAAFRLIVSSGDPVVAVGSPVTLAAFAEPARLGQPLPAGATLIVREPDGSERRFPMVVDGRGVFRATRDAAGGFEYAVEVGGTRTDWHTVTAVEPVGLAAGGTVRIDPPNYAKSSRPARAIDGFGPFDAPQFGLASFDLRFTRPAADAYLDWRPGGGNPAHVPLVLSPDRQSGRATLPLEQSGTLKLVLAAEKNVRTEVPVAVRVVPDAPPRFEVATMLGIGPWEVAADGTIRGELAVRDDFGVAAVRLESGVNGAPPSSEPVPLAGVGTPNAEGTFSLPLAGKVKVGDSVRVRARASDNRSVSERGMRPQESAYPPDGWAEFRVVPSPGRPLFEQQALEHRDRMKRELGAAAEAVRDASRRAERVRTEAAGEESLSVDRVALLTEARDDAAGVSRQLNALAVEFEPVPDLRPLAVEFREVSAGPLTEAADRLRAALVAVNADGRDSALSVAAERLDSAASKLAARAAGADRFAQIRIDRRTLADIADELRAMPDDPAKREALARRLAAAVAASPVLSEAADAAEVDAIRATLKRVKRTDADLSRLIAAIAETERLARRQMLAGLADRQNAFAAELAEFARGTETPARLADAAPISPASATDAVALLKRGDTTAAAAEQEKAARELDRLAEAFAAAAAARADTREAARQLARWQADLRQRVADAGSLAPADRDRFAAEQRAIRDAVKRLTVPADVPSHSAALVSTAAAEPLTADTLRAAADALKALAERVPTREQRLRATRDAAEKLIREQDAVGRLNGNQRVDAANRQDDLVRRIDDLDAPGLEHRRAAASDAARRAAADLRAGYGYDIPLSQHQARRQLDRLRQAADGATPNDERAADLAGLQRSLADAADKLPANPTDDDFRPLRLLQRELARQINALPAPEAPYRLADARSAVARSEQAVKQGDAADFRRAGKAAAEAIARLADQLTGKESDLERVQALLKLRAAAADRAKLAPRTPPTPEEAAATDQLLQREADELAQIRAGAAQGAKKLAADALARLRQQPDADRQQSALAALKYLADAMNRNGDRSVGHPLPPKAAPIDPAGPDAARGLPTVAAATAARELARKQRTLRDDVAKAAAELARGVRPGPADPLAELLRDQLALAADIERHADDENGVLPSAVDSAWRAADRLQIGATEEADSAARAATRLLRLAGLSVIDGTEARAFAVRQEAILARIAAVADDLTARATRQRNELTELTRICETLAGELDRASVRVRGARLSADADQLARTADALRRSAPALILAGREADAGRPTPFNDALRTAAAALADAATASSAAVKPAPPGDANARAAVAAIRHAEAALRAGDANASRQALADAQRWLGQ